jgi:hypothetical protein
MVLMGISVQVEERRKGTENVALRLCYAFCILFPTMPALLKEHAEMMVSCGLVGEAMHIFEELELWDNLIDCYCLLGKKAAASDLINQRLQLCPNDPRLWCAQILTLLEQYNTRPNFGTSVLH